MFLSIHGKINDAAEKHTQRADDGVEVARCTLQLRLQRGDLPQ